MFRSRLLYLSLFVFSFLAISSTFSSPVSVSASGTTTPIVSYSFDTGYGSYAMDSSGHNANGTLGSGITWTSNGKFGDALEFASTTTGYVSLPTPAELVGQGTVSFWYKPFYSATSTVAHFLFGLGPNSGFPLLLFANTPYQPIRVNNNYSGAALLSYTSILENEWSNITYTWDSSTGQEAYYLNGVLNESASTTPWAESNASLLFIGSSAADGIIDNVRIYNTALTQAEVVADMNTPVPPPPTDTTPPSVAIETPQGGITVTGTVSITASSSDNIGVNHLALSVDGRSVATTTSSSFQLDTSAFSSESHTLSVTAYDDAGNTSSASIQLMFDNTTPAPGSPVWTLQPTATGFRWVSPLGVVLNKSIGADLVDEDLLTRAGQFPTAIPDKYPTATDWAQAQTDRLRSWGFTTVGEASGGYTGGTYATINKPLEAEWESPISGYITDDDHSYHVKNLNHNFTGMVCAPSYLTPGGGTPDPFDPGFAAAYDQVVAGATDITATGTNAHDMFIIPEEADNLFGLDSITTHPDFGMILLDMNPEQDVSGDGGYTYTDHTVYAKGALRDWLKQKYGTITALNSAWGTNYTTWDTSDASGTAGIAAGTYSSYGTGTGFLDENGTHTLSSATKANCNNVLVNDDWSITPQIKTDMHEFVAYFVQMYAQGVAAAFAQPSISPHPPVFLPLYDAPSYVYTAAAPYFAGFWVNPSSSSDLSRIIAASSVNGSSTPLIEADYSTADLDSPFYANGSSTYNTQAAKGEGMVVRWSDAIQQKDINGKEVVVGLDHWPLYDQNNENWDGGLVTSDGDNPYDGSASDVNATTSVVWQSSHTYTAPAIIYDGTNYEAISGGITGSCTSGASTPVWSTTNGQVTNDNTCIWRNEGPYPLKAEPDIPASATIPNQAYGDLITPLQNFLYPLNHSTSSPSDTTAPSTPASLTASAQSSSQINLSWTASTDNVGVTGYKVYRNSTLIGTTAATSYSDTGLSAATSYSYTVAAYDAAGNASAQSTAASATTSSAPSGGGGGGGGSSGGGGGGSSSGSSGSSGQNISQSVPTSTTPTTSPATPPAAPVATFTSNLAPGMHSTDVANLQTTLIDLGLLAPGNSTGYYGPLTEAAVKKFQAEHGIVSSGTPSTTGYGTVGPKTRAALNALGSTSTSISISSASPTVNQSVIDSLKKEIAQLVSLVANLTAKVQAVISHRPTSTPATQSSSISTSSASATELSSDLSQGSKGSDVTLLQKFLVSRGYLPQDDVTGYYGPLTTAAVKSFQTSYSLATPGEPSSEYGTVGPNTRSMINTLLGLLHSPLQ